MAATCALSALPVFGSMAGGAAKLVMKNARTANKVANCIQSVSKVMSFTATATMSAIDTGYAVSDAYTAAKNGNLTVGAVGSVVLNATATVLAGAATVGSVTKAADAISSLRSEPINHAMSGVSAATSKLHNDVRSGNEVGLGNGNTVGANAKDATVGNKVKDVVKGGDGSNSLGIANGKTPASRFADKLRGLSNSKRPNTVAVVRTADGRYYAGYNKAGIYNESVQNALNNLGNSNQFNRQCAEVNALSRALNKGADLSDTTISIANVRGINNKSGLHGIYKAPCNVCQPLLDFLGIEDIH